MLNRKVSEQIDRVFDEMDKESPGSDKFNNLLQNLKDFDEIRLEEYGIDFEDRKLDIKERELDKEEKSRWWHGFNPNIVMLVVVGCFSTLSIINRVNINQNSQKIQRI